MSSYTRTNIYLTTIQKEALELLAEAKGLKTAELIRRIMDEYLEKETPRG